MRKHIIERAYELARGGACASIRDLERKLLAEGYEGLNMAHLRSPSLRADLAKICRPTAPAVAPEAEPARG